MKRVLVFYAVYRESDCRAAINRNVLAGKCKLSTKPRLETMLLVADREEEGEWDVGCRAGPRDAGYFVN